MIQGKKLFALSAAALFNKSIKLGSVKIDDDLTSH